MKGYLRDALPSNRPQSEPIRSDQVANSAGGHVWKVGPLERLRRFLILGSEGGSYYAGERELTRENVDSVINAVRELGTDAVEEIIAVSRDGRAPKNDQAIFALAVAASEGDAPTRDLALRSMPAVCRTGTHLFQFVETLDQARGWGRAARRAVATWYEERDPRSLAYQLLKYRQRDGWTHRDVLRLCHARAVTPEHAILYGVALDQWTTAEYRDDLRILTGFKMAQTSPTPAETAQLIAEFGLSREMILSDHLASPDVWAALVRGDSLPIGALIRNLGNMTRIGLLHPTAAETTKIVERLGNVEELQRGRVHPLAVLTALKTYAQGHGMRGAGTWDPVARIVDALDEAFYLAFKTVESTGKRYLIGVDVSGSMDWVTVAGSSLTPREAAAALAMTTVQSEDLVEVTAFTSDFVPLNISRRSRLDDVVNTTKRLAIGRTDCALPMLYATRKRREVDVFVVLTDNETWYGQIHPSQALLEYRRQSGIDAKLAVVGMVANGFSIADPKDSGMLDLVGFDSAVPQVLAAFARGDLDAR